ncbi:MAG: glycosyl hydrolase family 18 protein [Clostridium sp.]
MLRKLISKKTKSLVALATVTALLMTSAVPAAATTLLQDKQTKETSVQATQKYRNVMYYGDWSVWGGQKNFYPQDIPADQLTHLNFAFLDFNSNGELIFTDKDAAMTHNLGYKDDVLLAGQANAGILNGFKVLKSENPNLKIGVSLGGWSMSGDFTKVAKDPQKRATLVQNVMDFIKYTNMDFVDVDWEYPTAKRDGDKCDNSRDEGTPDGCPEDKQYFIDLLQDLRDALDKQGKELGKTYELTVALPAPIAKVESGIDVPKLFELVDFANIMTYDMRGAWDQISGHQAGLYTNPKDPMAGKGLSIDESVNYYMDQGAPSDKIVIGAAYYTRGWEKVSNEGIDPKNPGLFGTAAVCTTDADGTPSTGANPEIAIKNGEGGRMTGVWSYNALDDLKKRYSGLQEYWDDVAKAPYLYNPNNGAFFTYDNARSIKEKCDYVKENNLGGMIAWMASMDKATTSTKRDELTKATKEGLYGSTDLIDHNVKYDKLDVTAKLEVGKADAFCKGKGKLDLTITNNEKVTSKGEVLTAVETNAKTVMNARIYIETSGVEIIAGLFPLNENSIHQEDGKYYINVNEAWGGGFIKPGESKKYSFDIKDPLTDLEGIVSVSMKQRIYPMSALFGDQTLYGYNSDEEEVGPDGNTLPNIHGVRSKKINIGEGFDPLAGVTATDKEDGDLTSKVTVTGNINIRKAGKYDLTYSVVDNNAAKRSVTVTLTVGVKLQPLPDNYDSKKVYSKGDRVYYGGVEYECQGHGIVNFTPGTHEGIWKTIGIAQEEVKPDILDLATVAAKYNYKKGDKSYSLNCDVNCDAIIDLFDLVIIAKDIA